MNDLENTEKNRMKAELEAYHNQLMIQRLNFSKELKEGVGEEIKRDLEAPKPKISWFSRFVNKLLKICQ